MKTGRMILLLMAIIILLPVLPCSARELYLTVYQKNFVLVRDVRNLALEKGLNEIVFENVPSTIEAGSVLVTAKGGPGVNILDKRYQQALVGTDKLLDNNLGSVVEVTTKAGKVLSGKLLSSDGAGILLGEAPGARFISRDEVREIKFTSIPPQLLLKPTLFATVESDRAAARDFDLSYLANGMNWRAEYAAKLDRSESKFFLSGSIVIENMTGASFGEAKLKFVTGDVKRAQEVRFSRRYGEAVQVREMALSVAPDGGMDEEQVSDYHVYKLDRRVPVNDGETKIVSFFEPESVAVKKTFRYDGALYGTRVAISYEFTNSEKNGPGIPLPAGKFKVYKESQDGTAEFLGEDAIQHSPRDEKVAVSPGYAFDIVGERAVKASARINDRMREESIEIILRNHRTENTAVSVVEHFGGDWEIIKRSHDFVKKNASTIEFPVTVAKDDTVTVSYTVRVRN